MYRPDLSLNEFGAYGYSDFHFLKSLRLRGQNMYTQSRESLKEERVVHADLTAEIHSLSQRLTRSLTAQKTGLDKSAKLERQVHDLTQHLSDQAQTYKRMNEMLRAADREREIWKRYSSYQQSQLQQVKSVVESLRRRALLDHHHCDSLISLIDEADEASGNERLPPSNAFQTTVGGANVTGSTIRVMHKALVIMSHEVEQSKIKHLCGSADHGDFVDWIINKAADGR
jgi:hypothetical protein